jgi:hypothetical protein
MKDPDRPESTVERMLRVLLKRLRCADCGGPYRAENVYFLDEMALASWDVAVVCHQCYALSLVRAVVTSPVPDQELTPTEERRLRGLPPLAIDDVLDVAAFLVNFNGDFQRLFDQNRRDAHDISEASG